MNICVAVKRVIDYNVKIRVKPDHSGIDRDQVKMSMNPFCEIAVEEALRLREKLGGKVTLVTVGDEQSIDILRHGLALGADDAILVLLPKTEHHLLNDALNIAKILARVIQQRDVKLMLLGKQAIDNDNHQTGQMLAALLEWPQATCASLIESHEENELHVTRETDAGLEKIAINLPAVITTDLRLNTPRYATLPNIMKAKKKPLETLDFNTLGLSLSHCLTIKSVTPPPVKQPGIKVHSVEELVQKLRDEAKVIT